MSAGAKYGTASGTALSSHPQWIGINHHRVTRNSRSIFCINAMQTGSPTPWSYFLIRLLFRFVLKIFYGTIVVENAHLVPATGKPCIVCSNHSNSLTDALLLVATIPTKRRNMLRLTAKATLFGQRNFTSWLIESAGTVPIKRRKDYAGGHEVDNTEVMLKLMEALEMGDAVCLFPEGISRYHPTVAPLKTGVARIVSDVLTRNRDNSDFEVSILTCSITYMHRQHFRSDVLVTFHEPMTFRPKDNPELLAPADLQSIRDITSQMQDKIRSGTWDSPSWELLRIAKLAARMYAPLGTFMTLGEYVRLTKKFLDVFKTVQTSADKDPRHNPDLNEWEYSIPELKRLCTDLKAYQDEIAVLGIKDDRMRRPLPRRAILIRLSIRFIWSIFLFTISFPGLLLWLPIFATTFYATDRVKKTGPISDTWDEISHNKLSYGLASGIFVWLSAVVLTWPIAPITSILVPSLMWITLRWFEDAISAFRAFIALLRLLRVGKPALKVMRGKREDLYSRVMNVAINTLGLPPDPENYFTNIGSREKGRISGHWDSKARYFSIKRRRKRDWNEILRLYDKVDYPDDD